MSFLQELKRRNVFRVAVLYLVSGWVLLQVADVLAGVLSLPDWTLRLVAFLLLLGFPLALIFSWVFELTPEGLKREVEIDRTMSITPDTGRKLKLVTALLVLVGIGLFALDRLALTEPGQQTGTAAAPGPAISAARDTGAGSEARSIAVLPFVNMSADQDNTYFSDGLSEELLNFLAKVDGLKVAARTSSFQFRNVEADIGDIGRQLKVATVLEGSVRKAGNQVRITAQLIDTDSGYHLWSESYDRDLDNVFEVQEEIARAIVEALQLPLLGPGAAPLTVASTRSVEAYDLYLLGRHHARDTTAAAFRKAIDYFEQAIEADPDFALAYSGLADAYMYLSDYGGIAITEAGRLARAAAEKALSLDPEAAEPYASLGLILDYQAHAAESLEYFDRALAIKPNYANALLWKASVLQDVGRSRESLAMVERAYELDPLSMFTKSRLVQALGGVGDYEQAEQLVREMIATNPHTPFPYEELGNLWFERGQMHLAVPEFIAAHELRPDDTYMAWRLVQCFIGLDDLDVARHWQAEAAQRGPEAIYTIRSRALVLRYSGQPAAYLEYALERAELEPGNAGLRVEVGLARYMAGDLAGAEADLRRALDLTGYTETTEPLVFNQGSAAVLLAAVLQQQGKTDESGLILESLESLQNRLVAGGMTYGDRYWLDMGIAALRGERATLLAVMQRALDYGLVGHLTLVNSPVLAPYLGDPDFQAQIERMREDEARMRAELARSPRYQGVSAHRGT